MLTSESAAPGVHKRFRCLLALGALLLDRFVLALPRIILPCAQQSSHTRQWCWCCCGC